MDKSWHLGGREAVGMSLVFQCYRHGPPTEIAFFFVQKQRIRPGDTWIIIEIEIISISRMEVKQRAAKG